MIAHHIELSCRTLKPKLSAMKFLVILALVACVAARPGDKPDVYERYKDFDVKEVIGNERLVSGYSKCWLREGKCTPEASDFRGVIPDAMQNNCGKCSEHQKKQVALVIKAIQEKFPEDWEKLNKIYNPDGKFTNGFKEFVDKYAKE